jgi:hypothetical protein
MMVGAMRLPEIVLIVISIAAYVGLRHVAARRVAAGDTRWLWVTFGVPIVAGLVLIGASIAMLATSPLVGITVGVFGVLTAGASVLLVTRTQRAMAGAATPDQRVDAMMGPVSDHIVVWGGAFALVAVALLVGVLVVGLTGGFR